MPKCYQQGCVNVLTLDDRLGAEEAPEVTAALSDMLGSGVPQVVVDLSPVRIADSQGLECLCELCTKCRSLGGEAKLAAPRPLIRDILRATGIDQQVAILDDVITAAGEFAL